jgi:type VI protein secretion system component VasK
MLKRVASFFHWLGAPIRAIRALFPFTYDGRQTLIYLMCAFSAPVLTLLVMHILDELAGAQQWPAYREISRIVAYSLLISVCAFSMFVAFRSLSLGSKDGLLNLSGKEEQRSQVDPVIAAAKEVKAEVNQAAAEAVEKVEAKVAADAPIGPEPAEPLPDYAR